MTIGLDGNEANVKNRVGSGVYAHQMLLEFSKDKNHDFVVSLKEKPLAHLPKESENFKYKVFGPKKLWTRFALPVSLTFGQKPDVFASLGHYGPRFSRVPYAVTIFDLSYLHFPHMFRKEDLYQLVNWSKHSIVHANHIFAISKSTKDDIVKNYNISPSKITVTYMGYDNKRFKPQPKSVVEKVKSKFKIKGNYIIFVGTLQPRKNIEKLIEAFASIVYSTQYTVNSRKKSVNHEPSTDNLSLIIVGKKGWLYEPIFQKVKELNLGSKVIFTDYVPDDELPALISGAKAYVLPSLWEGFGMPVVEVQACGTPVIVSNTSSLPEIVGESGILVDPTNIDSITKGITGVISDDKHAQDLVRRGFTNVKRFSWQKCAKETLEVLESLNP